MSRQSNVGTVRKKMTDVDIRDTQRAERDTGILVNEKRKVRHEDTVEVDRLDQR